MKKTKELVKHACRQRDEAVRYLFGFKLETVEMNKLVSMARQYPAYYTSARMEKAKKLVGRIAVDCSGLISSCTKLERNSQGYHDTALYILDYEKYRNRNIFGLACWKQGHIGIGAGVGMTIEAKGIDFGVVETTDTHWTKLLYLKDIDYTPIKPVSPESPLYRILWLQHRLNRTIDAGLKVDGVYGESTASAVLKYRKLIGEYDYSMTGRHVNMELVRRLASGGC